LRALAGERRSFYCCRLRMCHPVMAVAVRLFAAAVGLWLPAMGPGDVLAGELTPAQERMKACNSRAKDKGLEGAERGKFMNASLNGQGKPADLSVRQQRHERCNAIAKERALEGAERRGYMTECEKPPAVKNASVRHATLDCER